MKLQLYHFFKIFFRDKDSLDHNDVKLEQPSQYDEQEASMSFYNEQLRSGRVVHKEMPEYLNAALDHHENFKQHVMTSDPTTNNLTVVGGTANKEADANFMDGLQTTEI